MAEIVFPGDTLAIEEEFAGGRHVFLNEGQLKSDALGIVSFDKTERTVSVKSFKDQDKIAKNDFVLAEIAFVRDNFLMADVFHVFSKGKLKIIPAQKTILAVADVSNAYVKNLKDFFKIGDIIKARVIDILPYRISLTTKDSDLGVIKSYCSKCRQPLQLFNNDLKCIACGRFEKRKCSNDYGKTNF